MTFQNKSKAKAGQDVAVQQKMQHARQQKDHQQKGKRATHPFINSQIIAAASKGECDILLSTICAYLPQMNIVNLSTAVHRLAKMSSHNQKSQAELRNHPVMDQLLVAIVNTLQNQELCEATQSQCLSNITWSLATMRLVNQPLIQLLANLATTHMNGFKSYELSTILWGFAKLHTADCTSTCVPPVFQAAARIIPNRTQQFEFRCLSMLVWAFATMRQRHNRVFSSVAAQMVPMVHEANCQEIANTVWAFGTVDLHDELLFLKLAEKAVVCMHTFKPQELSNLIWGFASNRCYNEALFAHAVEVAKVMDKREELQAQHLANILWGLARVQARGTITREAVLALLPSCTRQLSTFKPQEISSTAQAVSKAFGLTDEFARVNQSSSTTQFMQLPWQVSAFFVMIVPWAPSRVHEFSDQSLANIAGACTTVHVCDDSALFKAVEKEVLIRVKHGNFDHSQCLRLLKGLAGAPRNLCGTAVRKLFLEVSGFVDTLKHAELATLTKICVSLLGMPVSWELSKEELRSSCLTLAGERQEICTAKQKEIRLMQHNEICHGGQEEVYHPVQQERKELPPGPVPVSLSQAISMEANAAAFRATEERMAWMFGELTSAVQRDRPPDKNDGIEFQLPTKPPGKNDGIELPLTEELLSVDALSESDTSTELASSSNDDSLSDAKAPLIECSKEGEEDASMAKATMVLAAANWQFSVKNSFFHVECGSSTADGSDGESQDLEGSVCFESNWDSRSLQRSNSAPSIAGVW